MFQATHMPCFLIYNLGVDRTLPAAPMSGTAASRRPRRRDLRFTSTSSGECTRCRGSAQFCEHGSWILSVALIFQVPALMASSRKLLGGDVSPPVVAQSSNSHGKGAGSKKGPSSLMSSGLKKGGDGSVVSAPGAT